MGKVVEKFVLELENQLEDRQVTLEMTPEAQKWLAVEGYDALYGARPLTRVIQNAIKNRWRKNCCSESSPGAGMSVLMLWTESCLFPSPQAKGPRKKSNQLKRYVR